MLRRCRKGADYRTPEKMAFWKKRPTQTSTNHGVRVASWHPTTTHQYFHTSPPGGNDSAWCIDELESQKFGVVGLIVTMAAMAGGSVSSTFLLVNLHPKNVILLEIMIIITNFNDVDLLYYLLLDAFAQRRRVWCTVVAVERRRCRLTPRAILSHFSLSRVCFCGKALKPFFRGYDT
jgi:hypothetical protein